MFAVQLSTLFIFLHLTINTSNGKVLKSRLLPSTEVCGKQADNRIFGGEETELRHFPWMALLEYNIPGKGHRFHCGGALINNRYIMTAAHCVKKTLVSVRLGEHDLKTDRDCEDETPGLEFCSDPPKNVEIEEKIVFNSYKRNDNNHHGDIALLRLKENITFTEFITPICLPLADVLKNRNYAETKMVVAGWGKTENSSHSDVKLKVEVPVHSDSKCSSFYDKHSVNLIESQLCAGGEKGKDSCSGDSGGPLMFRYRTLTEENWYAIGVVSAGPDPCGSENWPAIYTKVPSYVQWIVGNLKP